MQKGVRTNVNDIPFLEFSLIGNTVANGFVDGPVGAICLTAQYAEVPADIRADRFRIMPIVERRRV